MADKKLEFIFKRENSFDHQIMNSWKSTVKLANDHSNDLSYVLIGCIRQVNDVPEASSYELSLGYQFIAADSIRGGTTSSLTRVAALEICKALKVIAFAPRSICIFWWCGIYVLRCKGIHNAFLLNACTV